MSTPVKNSKPPQSVDHEDPFFGQDMLAAMIMLHEGKKGNPVDYDQASKMARALMREDEKLPFDALRPKVA